MFFNRVIRKTGVNETVNTSATFNLKVIRKLCDRLYADFNSRSKVTPEQNSFLFSYGNIQKKGTWNSYDVLWCQAKLKEFFHLLNDDEG